MTLRRSCLRGLARPSQAIGVPTWLRSPYPASLVGLLAAALLLAGCGLLDTVPGLEVVSIGGTNGASVTRDGARIVFYGDPVGDWQQVERIFWTHHRRDVAWAGLQLVEDGVPVVAPAAELPLIENAEAFWSEFRGTRFHDYAQQSTKILARNVPVRFPAIGGRSIKWRDLAIDIIDTPGFTRGSVSYLVDLGRTRVAFTGDLAYSQGRIFDLYSLQDSIEETETRGYHGYAARSADLLRSLRRVLQAKPDLIVPARGPLIRDPEAELGRLAERIEELFKAYFRTDALRWYWGEANLLARARRILGPTEVDWMPMAFELRQTPPRWWHKFGTSRLLVSDTGAAFLIDCGSQSAFDTVRRLQRRRVFSRLEGIFVTHFHDDHTDFVQQMAREAGVPVYAGRETADILENPHAYRMPAMTHRPIRPVSALDEGETLHWHEFELEYTYFPGQAIYHGGLRVRRENGERYFFIGDSFSPSGLDDYCLLNRHLLHAGFGHFRCLDQIDRLEDDYWLVNQHIEEVFRYDRQQVATMREVLNEKKRVIAELVPWEEPNFGVDEQWSRFYPYGLDTAPGEPFDLYGVVLNHLPEEESFRIRLNLPAGWLGEPMFADLGVAPRQEGRVRFTVTPPGDMGGTHLITGDVSFRDHDLRQWIEALVHVR